MDIAGKLTLPDLIEDQSKLYNDKDFIIYHSLDDQVKKITYSEISSKAKRFATYLEELGVRHGDRVFIHLKNSIDYVISWFGISYLGAVMVPGNTYYTSREMDYVMQTSNPKIIITQEEFIPLLTVYNKTILLITDNQTGILPSKTIKFQNYLGHREISGSRTKCDDLLEILFTSGTTSNPKGVMLTHANHVWCAESVVADSRLSPEDRLYNCKPLFHVNCQSSVIGSLCAGATIVLGERYSASRFLEHCIEHHVTIASISGVIVRTLLKQAKSDLDQKHCIRFGRYAINVSLEEKEEFEERFKIKIVNGYGLSEAFISVASENPWGKSRYPSIGKPVIGRTVKIVDEDGNEVKPGIPGEIIVQGTPGRTIMKGYYNDEENTHQALKGDWLYTGDIGYYDKDGFIYYFDRKKDVIKRAGENISAAEVESVLINHTLVTDCAVVGIPDPIRDQSVKAFVVVKEHEYPEEKLIQELNAYCKQHLAYFKLPEYFEIIDSIPRNASGKILKRALSVVNESHKH